MNIFFLDRDPKIAAQYHCDKHVVKMIVETAQLMSSAHRVLDGEKVVGLSPSGRKATFWKHPTRDETLYKATHINHPSAVWVRSSVPNYIWTTQLFKHLLDEYKTRYNKNHACTRLLDVLSELPHNLPANVFFDPPLAMPEHCKLPNVIDSYRNYYKIEKRYFAKWKNGNIPEWF
jgi:hypothetical protein